MSKSKDLAWFTVRTGWLLADCSNEFCDWKATGSPLTVRAWAQAHSALTNHEARIEAKP